MSRVIPAVVLAVVVSLLPVQAAATPPGKPSVPGVPHAVFRDGQAQPVFDPAQAIREDRFVTAPVDSDHDGQDDRVHVHIVRPRETANGLRVPVVYQASPYFAGNNEVPNHPVDVELSSTSRAGGPQGIPQWAYEEYLLARGFAVVYAESLGTGQSTGCPTTGGLNETLGAKSVVDWLNSRAAAVGPQGVPARAEWTTGAVGMMGVSYNGTLPNAVASTGVEGLKATVPIGAISDWYEYYRSAGAVVAPSGFQGEDADVLAKYVHTRPDRQVCQPGIEAMARAQDRTTGDTNPFWQERNYLPHAGKVRAATLVAHGLNDWNVKPEQAAQWYAALKERQVPHKIWWHQGAHTDPIKVDRERWLTEINRWFTRYLYDVPNGVDAEPRASVQRENGSWTQHADWPAPTRPLRLHPSAGGAARGGLGLLPAPTGAERLTDNAQAMSQDLAAAPSSPHRLAYQTEATPESVRLSGTPTAQLRLSADRSAVNVTTLLVDYAPDGKATIITRGWTDPRNRESLAEQQPLTPGRPYDVTVHMQPDDYVLARGHRLGFVVLSSDHEFTLRPKPGAVLSVDLAASSVELPVTK